MKFFKNDGIGKQNLKIVGDPYEYATSFILEWGDEDEELKERERKQELDSVKWRIVMLEEKLNSQNELDNGK